MHYVAKMYTLARPKVGIRSDFFGRKSEYLSSLFGRCSSLVRCLFGKRGILRTTSEQSTNKGGRKRV